MSTLSYDGILVGVKVFVLGSLVLYYCNVIRGVCLRERLSEALTVLIWTASKSVKMMIRNHTCAASSFPMQYNSQSIDLFFQ